MHFGHGGDTRGFARACDRVRPVGLIAPGEELPPARVATLHENGTLGVLAISPEPLEHVATLVFGQAIVGESGSRTCSSAGTSGSSRCMPSEPEFAEIAAGRLEGAQAAAAEHGATVIPVHAARSARSPPHSRPCSSSGRRRCTRFNDEYALAALESLPGGAWR